MHEGGQGGGRGRSRGGRGHGGQQGGGEVAMSSVEEAQEGEGGDGGLAAEVGVQLVQDDAFHARDIPRGALALGDGGEVARVRHHLGQLPQVCIPGGELAGQVEGAHGDAGQVLGLGLWKGRLGQVGR